MLNDGLFMSFYLLTDLPDLANPQVSNPLGT